MINWLKQLLGVPEQKKSSLIAKERLMVIVAHERGGHENQPDFLPLLQKELTEVIAKYVKIDKEQVQVEFEQKGGRSVLELNVTLPETEIKPSVKVVKSTVAATTPKQSSPATAAPKKRGRPAKPKG